MDHWRHDSLSLGQLYTTKLLWSQVEFLRKKRQFSIEQLPVGPSFIKIGFTSTLFCNDILSVCGKGNQVSTIFVT